MSKNFTLDALTEGIRQRHLGLHNRRLVEKWSRTGLLRGLDGVKRENMAMMLENQAGQLLREANSLGDGAGSLTASGDIRGFTNIAFPIVRRVFGGLVANELVSIQPMSLPSGLLFYLDYTYGSAAGGSQGVGGTPDATDAATYMSGTSIYNNPVGRGVRSGSLGQGGQYDLAGSGFSKVHETALAEATTQVGAHAGSGAWGANVLHHSGTDGKLIQFDPSLTADIDDLAGDAVLGIGNGDGSGLYQAVVFDLTTAGCANADRTMVKDFALYNADGGNTGTTSAPAASVQGGGRNILNVRRLNQIGTHDGSSWTPDPLGGTDLLCIVGNGAGTSHVVGDAFDMSFVQSPVLDVNQTHGDTLTIPSFESDFGTDPSPAIPEIDIKIESIAVTASTRKLRARWSPELAQDLNAYHSLDAEVELTQILSEQIALEIDREILNDLLTQANGANLFWSRAPGKFVVKDTGVEVLQNQNAPGPAFTGTVREWYETLVETVIDCANTIHRKTLRGSANFMVVGPDVATILEASVLYRPSYSLDGDGQVGAPFTLGAEKAGTLSNRFTVYKDPYFPRNKILVGYKGGSYLETGYVYAPYVPLIVTPTIFAPEDFTPRKGVMTRYGKRMVRSDFYGTVTCLDMNVI